MSFPWFKFYGFDYLNSPTISRLTASERSCWVTLMCYAGNKNNLIEFLDEETLLIKSGIIPGTPEWEKTIGVLKKFVNFKMITLDNEVITLDNWQKRQEINLTPYERVKRYRIKKRNDNAMITLDKKRVDKIRVEKKRKEKIVDKLTSVNLSVAEQSSAGIIQPKEINETIDLFKEVNPAHEKFFGNKNQRSAIERMLKKIGLQRLTEAINTLKITNKMKFAPIITTPLQLEDKMGALLAFVQKESIAQEGKKIKEL